MTPETNREYVVVVGGSGSLGEMVCRLLGEAGFPPLVGFCHNREKAESIAAKSYGKPIQIDLLNTEKVIDAAQLPEEVDGVILCFSVEPVLAGFSRIDPEDLQQQVSSNIIGVHKLLSFLVRERFQKNKKGRVLGVLTAAMGSESSPAMKSMGAYVIGKYGLQAVLKVLDDEYAWMSVKTISPGFIDNDLLARVFDERYLEQLREENLMNSNDELAAEIVNAYLDSGQLDSGQGRG